MVLLVASVSTITLLARPGDDADADQTSAGATQPADPAVVATVDVADSPYEVAVRPDGRKALVTDGSPWSVQIVDIESATVEATIEFGANPNQIVVSPDGERAFVSVQTDEVAVIDIAARAVVATIPVGEFPDAMAVNADGTRLFVANRIDGSISVGGIPWASG